MIGRLGGWGIGRERGKADDCCELEIMRSEEWKSAVLGHGNDWNYTLCNVRCRGRWKAKRKQIKQRYQGTLRFASNK